MSTSELMHNPIFLSAAFYVIIAWILGCVVGGDYVDI